MDENILRFRVGIFVVIAMCILGILIFLNSEGWVQQYTVFIKPTKAPGVKVGTPIRKYGILIGRVNRVEPEDGYVLLGLGINQKEKIYRNELVSIGSESILGDAGIEIVPLPIEERGTPVQDEFTLNEVEVKRDPLTMFKDMQPQIEGTLLTMQQAGRSVGEASDEIRDFTKSLQSVFQDEEGELKAMLTDFRQTNLKAQAALDNFNRIFENVNNVVGDPQLKGQIRRALNEIPKIFQEIREAVAETREAVKAFGTIPDGVNASFDNIEELTAQLKEETPEVLAQINATLKNTDTMIDEVRRFADTLNEVDLEGGTVGKLLNETDIHDAILETARNVEETSTKLEPLMNDLRMFADAIARNPGAIVKGALRRKGDANYKGTAGRDGGLFK